MAVILLRRWNTGDGSSKRFAIIIKSMKRIKNGMMVN
jgi:hypothetical protein